MNKEKNPSEILKTTNHGHSSRMIRFPFIRIVLLIIIPLVFIAGGCSEFHFFYEPQGFYLYTGDARIFYETGAEAKVESIAASLDSTIKKLEKKLYRPFETPIRIYVFANLANYEKHAPSKNSGGVTFGGRYIILSPKKQNTLERLPRILAHELTHFHLFGYTGIVKARLLPTWFNEGLAVWASDGGGAENVTVEEARLAILKGQQINLIDQELVFGGKQSHPKGMSTHMFYRQSAMFIQYLYQINPRRFRTMLRLIQDKGNLKDAIRFTYHKPLSALWPEFRKSLQH